MLLVGVIIEEITEEVAPDLSQSSNGSAEVSVPKPLEINGQSHIQPDLASGAPSASAEYLQALKDDPESIRYGLHLLGIGFHNLRTRSFLMLYFMKCMVLIIFGPPGEVLKVE